MFAGVRVLISPEVGDTIVTAMEHYFSKGDVSPSVEGRIQIAAR